jgi:hypothetical protein
MAYSDVSRILATMKIETGDLAFLIYEGIVILGLIFRVCLEFEDKPTSNTLIKPLPPSEQQESIISVPETMVTRHTPKPVRKHPITKIEYRDFFQEVLSWCEQNIKLGKERKVKPKVEVSFNKNGNVLGYYEYSKKRIMMYVLRNESLSGNVKTFLHEYVHHLQIRNSQDSIRYNLMSKRKGYYNNDYEREARELSSYYLDDCCKYLDLIIR